jgi:DNA-binding FadR family transcriptional regulator
LRLRAEWKLLDPGILAWQTELTRDSRLVQLCELRLAIEPTGSGFAAVRAIQDHLDEIARRLMIREALPKDARPEQIVDLLGIL